MAFHFSNNEKPLHAQDKARDHAKNEIKPTLLLGLDESCLKINKKTKFQKKWLVELALTKLLYF